MPESFGRNALTEAVFYVLLSMHEPMHGYAVMQNIEKISGGRVILGAGTLYGAINTLLEKGWIEGVSSDKNSRKKEYIITEIGKSIVHDEIDRLEELLNNGKNIAGGDK
jgi:DNA-binding PadR family transcriptional regulator